MKAQLAAETLLDALAHSAQSDGVIDRKLVMDTISAVRTGAWQPIETAPRDGSWVLVWRPTESKSHSAHCGIDRWLDRDIYGVWWRSRPGQQPTHWMPLPEPPSET